MTLCERCLRDTGGYSVHAVSEVYEEGRCSRCGQPIREGGREEPDVDARDPV